MKDRRDLYGADEDVGLGFFGFIIWAFVLAVDSYVNISMTPGVTRTLGFVFISVGTLMFTGALGYTLWDTWRRQGKHE